VSQRRRTLLKRGLAAAVVAGGAGWYVRDDLDSRFWLDPPAFDPSGIETVTDTSVPTPPRQVPVSPAPLVEPFERRVESLLGGVPEPVPSDTLPNGAFRTRIAERRTAARTALDRAREADTTVETRDALVAAREQACEAATVWASVNSRTPVTTVVPDRERVRTAVEAAEAALLGPAPSPLVGARVYAALAAPVETNDRVPDADRTDAHSPFEAAETARGLEQTAAHATAARLLATRYAETVSGEPTGSVLAGTVEALGDAVVDRYRTLHRAATGGTPTPRSGGSNWSLLDSPDTDTYVDADVPTEAPSRQLLRDRTWPLFDRFRGPVSAPFAWAYADSDYPALVVRQTHWLLSWHAALDSLRTRIREGLRLYPADATQVRNRRQAAVDAVTRLIDDGNPLEQWVARRLCDAFEQPDDRLAGVTADTVGDDAERDGETVSRRGVAESYATYDWIVTVADATERATATVTEAVRRARASTDENQ